MQNETARDLISYLSSITNGREMFSSGNGDGFYGKPQEAVDMVQREEELQFVRLKTGSWGQSTQQVAGSDGV